MIYENSRITTEDRALIDSLASYLGAEPARPRSAADIKRRRQELLDTCAAVALYGPRLGALLRQSHAVTAADFDGEHDARLCFEAALEIADLAARVNPQATVRDLRHAAVELAAFRCDRHGRRLSIDDVARLALFGSDDGPLVMRWTRDPPPPDPFDIPAPSERFAAAIAGARQLQAALVEIRTHRAAAQRHEREARDIERSAAA